MFTFIRLSYFQVYSTRKFLFIWIANSLLHFFNKSRGDIISRFLSLRLLHFRRSVLLSAVFLAGRVLLSTWMYVILSYWPLQSITTSLSPQKSRSGESVLYCILWWCGSRIQGSKAMLCACFPLPPRRLYLQALLAECG